RKLLRNAVLVPADVGHKKTVFRKRPPEVAENAFWPHRKLRRLPLVLELRLELLPATRDVLAHRSACNRLDAARGTDEHTERGLRVGHDAEFRRIVAPDLGRIGVGVDEEHTRDTQPRL